MPPEDALAQRYGQTFAKGTVLFREGEAGHQMFVVRSGEVAISKSVGDVEKQLVTLGPGEFFGEMSILNRKPRTATATVLTESLLLVIDPRTFEAMLRGNAEIAIRMIKQLADRLAEADAQIENLLLPDPDGRVAHYLAYAARARGQAGPDGVTVALQIGDLPATLNLKPEQVKEAFQKLARAGLVAFQTDQIRIRDIGQLLASQGLTGLPEATGNAGPAGERPSSLSRGETE